MHNCRFFGATANGGRISNNCQNLGNCHQLQHITTIKTNINIKGTYKTMINNKQLAYNYIMGYIKRLNETTDQNEKRELYHTISDLKGLYYIAFDEFFVGDM